MQCNSYLINQDTLALELVFVDGFRSRIVTMQGIYYSKMSKESLLEKACIRYGSAFDGRIQAIRMFLEYRHKTPLLIDPEEVGAFPTISYLHPECVWLFSHHFQIKVLSAYRSEVIFSNGYSIQVNVSKHVLIKQQQRLSTAMEAFRSIYRNKVAYIAKPPKIINLE